MNKERGHLRANLYINIATRRHWEFKFIVAVAALSAKIVSLHVSLIRNSSLSPLFRREMSEEFQYAGDGDGT